jgi:hypothetical protein
MELIQFVACFQILPYVYEQSGWEQEPSEPKPHLVAAQAPPK